MGISNPRLIGPISFRVWRVEGESRDSLIFKLSSEAPANFFTFHSTTLSLARCSAAC
eukprot:CAMPEP_0182510186 /NCGR_PEP_ID=MMETSP1321-20130603/28210_1 /TAXON_ID=91990 /ORGANISM="Bolidomonas sp., Strain RCC1657" /LENGTH=56 /DNA_ID=CAMNT_0024716601 /DNA_START=111 /DNA_END=278 /DNA_ORIENTATION=+